QDRELSGLNAMAMGIWYESLLRWTGGVTNVLARTKVVVPVRRDAVTGAPRAATVPEHVEVIGDMAGGATFHLQISSVTGLTHPARGGALRQRGYAQVRAGRRRPSAGRASR